MTVVAVVIANALLLGSIIKLALAEMIFEIPIGVAYSAAALGLSIHPRTRILSIAAAMMGMVSEAIVGYSVRPISDWSGMAWIQVTSICMMGVIVLVLCGCVEVFDQQS